MKKIVALFLVLACAFAIVACKKTPEHTEHVDANHDGKCDECDSAVAVQHTDANHDGKCDGCGASVEVNHTDANGDGLCDVCGAALSETTDPYDQFVANTTAHDPAKITTLVTYINGEDSLSGRYVTIKGEDMVTFRYAYDRYAKVEEEADSRILRTEGTLYYKDGKIAAADGEDEPSEWVAVTPSGIHAALDLTKCKDNAVLSEDGSLLTATLSGDAIVSVLGTDLSAKGDVKLTVSVSNLYLTNIKVEYQTEGGASVVVETSYTYSSSESEDVDIQQALANVAALCRVSSPTKIVTNTTEVVGGITMHSDSTLKVGTIGYGGKSVAAATYVRNVEKIATVNNEDTLTTETNTYEYIEGVGRRTNGGEWNANGASLIPTAGFLSFGSLENVKTATYSNGTLSFVVEKADVSSVLRAFLGGRVVDADVNVTVSNVSGVISQITLSYVLAADASDEKPNAVNPNEYIVTITADYTYDVEEISIR